MAEAEGEGASPERPRAEPENLRDECRDCEEDSSLETFTLSSVELLLGSVTEALSTLLVGTTALGGLAELKYLPPPGFEEEKEE